MTYPSEMAKAVQAYVQPKIAELNDLVALAGQPSVPLAVLARKHAAFLSSLFDDHAFSVSSPHVDGLTSDSGGVGGLNMLVAGAYGAAAARVGLAGSSNSILAVIGMMTRLLAPGRNIVLADGGSHKSVPGGLILSGHKTAFLPVRIDPRLGVPEPVRASVVEELLGRHVGAVAAVVVTSPTYAGFDADLEDIGALCRAHGVPLIVDAAWGSQYGLFPEFPACAIRHADIVITSPHKAGLAACQTSVVLFRSAEHARLFDEAGDFGFATTSANQLLLLVYEHRLSDVLEARPEASWSDGLRLADAVRRHVADIHPDLAVARPQDIGAASGNPAHVLLYTGAVPVDGQRWLKTLSEHRVDAEMATQTSMLLLFGRGAPANAKTLIAALAGSLDETPKLARPVDAMPARPELGDGGAVDLRSAFCSPTETVAVTDACGRRAAGVVTEYPPGQPLFVPGQIITPAHVSIVQNARASGASLTGLQPDGGIRVLRADQAARLDKRVGSVGGRRIEVVASSDLTDAQIALFADFFRETFCNPPFDQFAFHAAEPLTPVSASHFLLGRAPDKRDYFTLAQMDALALPEGYHRWTDPQVCVDVLKRRFQCEGYVVFVTDDATERLDGLLHCRLCSLRVLFDTEEWRNPLLFSGFEDPALLGDEARFLAKAKHHFGLCAEDEVMTISAVALRPQARVRDNLFFRMLNALTEFVSPEHAAAPFLAEIPDEGAARGIDIAVNERLVHGLLPNGHDVVFTDPASRMFWHFEKDEGRFNRSLRRSIRERKRGYRPHPTDNRNVEVRTIAGVGRGVFATAPIEAGETIAVFIGERYQAESATSLPRVMVDHAIQVGPTEFVHGEGGLAELCNHSCAPNAGVRRFTELFAARRIEAGEEICWDYRCSENSDWRLDPCLCGTSACTGAVGAFASLPEARRREYLARGMVSEWIAKAIASERERHGV